MGTDPEVWIDRVGRWRWQVWVEDGAVRDESPPGTYALTRAGAIRKGRRLLASYCRQIGVSPTRERVGGTDGD